MMGTKAKRRPRDTTYSLKFTDAKWRGTVRVRGAEEFVSVAAKHLNGLLAETFSDWVDRQVKAGVPRERAIREVLDEVHKVQAQLKARKTKQRR